MSGPRGRLAAAMLAAVLLGLAAAPTAHAAEPADYGDAPVYLELGDPARALLGGPRLGATVSADPVDPDSQGSSRAGDSALGDDDDGAEPLAPLATGRLADVPVPVTLSGVVAPAVLCGWIDFDVDATFADAEGSCVDVPAGATAATVTLLGQAPFAGASYLRLRVGTDRATVSRPTGQSSDGEVEDYPVSFVDPAPDPEPALTLTAAATPARVESADQPVRWRFVVTNSGALPLTGVAVDPGTDAVPTPRCTPAAPAALAPGQQLTCTAEAALGQRAFDEGGLELSAQASADPPDGDPADPSDDVVAVGAATVTAVQRTGLSLGLVVSPSAPRAGSTATVTLTLRNTGSATLTDVVPSDGSGRLGVVTCNGDRTLAPGERLGCRVGLRVTAADARRGRLVVAAVARAEPPFGSHDSPRDDVTATARTTVPVRPAAGTTGPYGSATPTPTAPPAGPDVDGATGPAADLADSGGVSSLPLVGGLAALLVGGALLGLLRRRRPPRRG